MLLRPAPDHQIIGLGSTAGEDDLTGIPERQRLRDLFPGAVQKLSGPATFMVGRRGIEGPFTLDLGHAFPNAPVQGRRCCMIEVDAVHGRSVRVHLAARGSR
jgi:hypothetical protein